MQQRLEHELKLGLVQAHMAQKPMLRVEVGVRALRVRESGHEAPAEAVNFSSLTLLMAAASGRAKSRCARSVREGDLFLVAGAPHGGRKRPNACLASYLLFSPQTCCSRRLQLKRYERQRSTVRAGAP